MSYPYIGMTDVLPPDKQWNAAGIEWMLRNGSHIYLEEEEPHQVVYFGEGRKNPATGKFHIEELKEWPLGKNALYTTDSFVELASHIAFHRSAEAAEKRLRGGETIDLRYEFSGKIVAAYDQGFLVRSGDKVFKEFESFVELAVWEAFMGRDFL